MNSEENSSVIDLSFSKTRLASAEGMEDLIDGLTELRDGVRTFVEAMYNEDWSDKDRDAIMFAHDLMEVAMGVKMMASIMLTSASDPQTVEIAIRANQLGSRIGAAIIEFAIAYGRGDTEVSTVEAMKNLKSDINTSQGNSNNADASVKESWDATTMFGGDFKA